MRNRFLAMTMLFAIAMAMQTVLPLLSGNMMVAQPLLGLLVVLSLRVGKTGGILLGAILGALTDALQGSQIGFHGISMTLIGYILAWVGGRVIIRGVNPVTLFTLLAYVFDVSTVALLHLLLALSLAKTQWWWVLPGCLFTGVFAIGLEMAAKRLMPPEGGGYGSLR